MHPVIEQHREEVEALCRRYRVRRLEVFGSAATGEFQPERSDLDFLVEFEPDQAMNIADQYFGLLEDLKSVFRRDVDLLTARSLRNPYFAEAVRKTKAAVYGAPKP